MKKLDQIEPFLNGGYNYPNINLFIKFFEIKSLLCCQNNNEGRSVVYSYYAPKLDG